MCRIKKTAAFEYIVTKLIGLDLKKENMAAMDPAKRKELNEKLSEYPMTRYMKLLYFLCLKDTQIKKDEQVSNNTFTGWDNLKTTATLLNVFDNFVAYQNGPVEIDIYENRRNEGMFSLFTFENNGQLKLRENNLDSKAKSVLNETDNNLETAVDDALKALDENGSKIIPGKSILEQSTTAVVELSHKLDPNVWNDCFYYNKQDGKISELFQIAGGGAILQAEVTAFQNSLKQIQKQAS
ncbi:hypothetical protein [Alloprevotella tannerae]|uniref:hypothetical protein n=1 Tax=Alloprevotella tannerae TaxID=76122 RepID=UPI00288AB31A|nr:hypothetical protein [Alloprevotella tannerae]